LQSCQANDLFTVELARRLALEVAAPLVTVTCLKIGVVKTNIRQGFPRWMKVLVPLLMDPLLGQTPQEAAHAAMRLLLAEDIEGLTGTLFLKIGKLRQIESSSRSPDSKECVRLWQLSEDLAARALAAPGSDPKLRRSQSP
jgi:hypothetical protein